MRRPHQPPQHRYRLHRSLVAGRAPTAIWCGHGVFAHNLVKVSTLAAAKNA
jgi:hypothetical protein